MFLEKRRRRTSEAFRKCIRATTRILIMSTKVLIWLSRRKRHQMSKNKMLLVIISIEKLLLF